MRVAIVHERFTEIGGSEKVVEQLHQIWPEAVVHTAILDPAGVPDGLAEATIRSTALDRLRRNGGGYGHLLPMLPMGFRRLDLGEVDLVITSHHAFANRVRPRPGVPVISYTHTPARWMWSDSMVAGEFGGAVGEMLLRGFSRSQRRADRAAAQRLTGIVVNSRHVARRVSRHWGRDSLVVPPPVSIDRFFPIEMRREDFFLVAGRLVPYKRADHAVAAARRAGVKLVVAGDGRYRSAVERAAGPETTILGTVSDAELVDLYRRCRALVFPGEEDFGIVPVEAQACGTPVIARRVGGVLDSVIDGRTGVLYDGPDPIEALAVALRNFDERQYDARVIRAHAEGFGADRFRERFVAAVGSILDRNSPEQTSEP